VTALDDSSFSPEKFIVSRIHYPEVALLVEIPMVYRCDAPRLWAAGGLRSPAMEMHQIRYFLALCDTLNFTRAAEHMHVSQPALTRAIQKLEEELGGILFRRERNLTHVTDLGQLMRPHLERILAETEEVQSTAKSFLKLDQAPLSVGVMCTVGPLRFVDFLNQFHSRHPGIEVTMNEGTPDTLKRSLEEGRVDVAILAQPAAFEDRLDAKAIYRERFVVGFAPGHRFEKTNAVKLGELKGESYLARIHCEFRDHIRNLREKHGADMRICFRSERDDWIQVMVTAGLGVCIVPQSCPTVPGLLTRPIIEPEIERDVCLVTMAGRRHSPALAAFVKEALAHKWIARR
jgi:DNA-binding transcriptional LysR family regulator